MQKFDVVEVRGIRVLTTKQIAEAYGADVKTVQYNFRYNKNKYVEGKHYIEIKDDELRRLKTRSEFQSSLKHAKRIYLWTEKGALLHAKSLNTDKAWEVYDYLVDFYFRAKEEQSEVEKNAVVPVKTTTEPVKEKHSIPQMDNPIKIFRILLKVAEDRKISVNSFSFETVDSMLHNNSIGIRKGVLLEKAVYELAWELAHAFIHYDNGDMIKSPLSKDYNEQSTRAADMIIKMLNTRVTMM